MMHVWFTAHEPYSGEEYWQCHGRVSLVPQREWRGGAELYKLSYPTENGRLEVRYYATSSSAARNMAADIMDGVQAVHQHEYIPLAL